MNKRRIKLWELPDQFHCSIVGTCLSVAELRRFARKGKLFQDRKPTDYEVHRAFAGALHEPEYVTRLIQKHLDRKYEAVVQQFAGACGEEALGSLWDEAVASGDVAGAYWALVTHPGLPEALIERVYGEIHMMSHLSGASCRADMQELAVLRVRTAALEEKLAHATAASFRSAAAHDKAVRELKQRAADSEKTRQELERAEAAIQALENGQDVGRLRSQVEDYAALLAEARARAERAEADARSWRGLAMQNGDLHLREQERAAEAQSERDALESVLEKLLAPDCSACEQQEECRQNADLCDRCILYVGGRARQSAQFRALVESRNGRFLFHDGGLEDGRYRLGAILSQADAVFCPLDCVSHDAAMRVKQFCKRTGKPFVFLPRSSLAAFSRGLNELAA